jgi:protein-tyrosine phosphatase
MRIRRWRIALLATAVALTAVGSGLDAGTAAATSTAVAASSRSASKSIPFVEATVTQTADGYDVTWTSTRAGRVQVFAGTNVGAVGHDLKVGAGRASGSIHVTGLPAAPRWYFELSPAKGGALVIADRMLHLASAPNFRDAGGYRTKDGRWVRMGVLYRSDGLDKLSDADYATVQALGIKLVCDLRTDYERGKGADRVIPGAENVVFDVAGDSDQTKAITEAVTSGDKAAQQEVLGNGKAAKILVDGGRSLVSSPSAKAAYSAMFARLEQPSSLPAIFHCSGGKDRSGWAAATLLTALGVARATVERDYLLSNDALRANNERTLAATAQLIDRALIEPLIVVRKQYLDASFDEVKKRFGTFDRYLARGLGIDATARARLEQELLIG